MVSRWVRRGVSSPTLVYSRRFAALVLLFFGSGACGLVYQVLWLRQLSLVFGVTVYAASTVLAVFMAGLALGSLVAGRLVARVRRPLVAFGIIEILIGALALATPAGLRAAELVHDALYRALPDATLLLTVTRVAGSLPVLIWPTMLMGVTLPLLGSSSVVRGPGIGSRLGALYAANTAGAMAGVLLAGYVLIGTIGMRRTYLAAAALNALVGCVALWIGRRDEQAVRETTLADTASLPSDTRIRRAVAFVIVASGAAALALEIVWFRILLQFLTATTYAFTTMLATVLGGIALGGAIGARVLARPRDWHAVLVRVLFATAIAVVFSLVFLAWSYQGGWRTGASIQMSAAAMLPAATLMGVAFPLAIRLGAFADAGDAASGSTVAVRVGRLYAMNVAGAIAGAITGGFLLLPWLGSRVSLITLAAVYVASALVLLAAHPRRSSLAAGAVARLAVFVAGAALVPDPFLATIERRHGAGLHEVWREEGAQTAVNILSSGRHRYLFLDGLHQADDTPDIVRVHRVIGHLPMLLHPAPSRVLVVGLGGGATPGAISLHRGSVVDIVELSPSVSRAAGELADLNNNLLVQPNVRIRMDDGRTFLRLTNERFDIITADLIQPTLAGSGRLYSREYYALVRRALRPGGLALQWIGSRPIEHYKVLIRTFVDVFPETTLWFGGSLLVGSTTPLRVSQRSFEDRLRQPQLSAAMSEVGLDDINTLRHWYSAGPEQLKRFLGPGEMLTDDRPLLEYYRSFDGGTGTVNAAEFGGRIEDVLRD
jgi:spermidine synthase